jgi:hypothetical protein
MQLSLAVRYSRPVMSSIYCNTLEYDEKLVNSLSLTISAVKFTWTYVHI